MSPESGTLLATFSELWDDSQITFKLRWSGSLTRLCERGFFFLGLSALSLLGLGAFPDLFKKPDTYLEWFQTGLVVWAFTIWLLSLFRLGRWVGKRAFGLAPSFSLLVGSLFWIVFGMLVGHFFGLGVFGKGLFLGVAFLGLFLTSQKERRSEIEFFKSFFSIPSQLKNLKTQKTEERVETLSELALFLVLVFSLFGALALNHHGDALYYHLVAPRSWVEAGKIEFIPSLPVLSQTGFWEILFLFPARLFFGADGRGLIETQVFSQLIHFVLGYCGSLYLLREVLKKALPELKYFSALFILSVATLGELVWTADLAKNDWGAVLFTVAALFLLLKREEENSTRFFFLSGALMGASFGTKYTAAFIDVGILISFFLIDLKKEKSFKKRGIEWGALVLGGMLVTAPLLIRNLVWTENPVYPSLQSIFHSPWVSETFGDFLIGFQSSFSQLTWGKIQSRLLEFLGASKLKVLVWLGWGIFLFRFRQIPLFLKTLGTSFLIGSFLFVGESGSSAELRLSGFTIILGVLVSIAVLVFELKEFKNLRLQRISLWVLLLAEVATARIPIHRVKHLMTESPKNLRILEHTGGDSKKWLRDRAQSDELIAFTGDNEVYYLSYLKTEVITQNPRYDSLIHGLSHTGPEAILRKLQELGVVYLLDINDHDGTPWPGLGRALFKDRAFFSRFLVFTGEKSRVYRLQQ